MNSKRNLGASVLLAGLLLTCLPVHAQWKWRDAQGRTQYSDLPPPPSVADKDILQRPAGLRPAAATPALAAPSAAAATPASGVDPVLEAKRKQAEQDEAARRKADEQKQAQTRVENCDRARAYLRTLDSGQRIARTNDKGEREYVDDATRAQEADKARQVAASECR